MGYSFGFLVIFEDFSAQWNTDTMENYDYRGRDRQSFNLLRVTYLEDWIDLSSVSTKLQWKKNIWNLLELIQDMQFLFQAICPEKSLKQFSYM